MNPGGNLQLGRLGSSVESLYTLRMTNEALRFRLFLDFRVGGWQKPYNLMGFLHISWSKTTTTLKTQAAPDKKT